MNNSMQQSALCCIVGHWSECEPTPDIIVGDTRTQEKSTHFIKNLHISGP